MNPLYPNIAFSFTQLNSQGTLPVPFGNKKYNAAIIKY